jgi:hypothetical protein
MGAAISTKIDWGTVPLPGSNATQITKTVSNYDMLTRLLHGLERLCSQYPNESRMEFSKMIQWPSAHLKPNLFSGNAWNVQNASRYSFFY